MDKRRALIITRDIELVGGGGRIGCRLVLSLLVVVGESAADWSFGGRGGGSELIGDRLRAISQFAFVQIRSKLGWWR